MGIDRWRQEHRNWRPNGVKLVVPETQADEPSPAAPSLVPGGKTPSAKPGVAKKQAASSSANANPSSDKAQAKRGKR